MSDARDEEHGVAAARPLLGFSVAASRRDHGHRPIKAIPKVAEGWPG